MRPFLNADPKTTLAYLLKASVDKNVHIRRWSSEGSRPRLPWGERLNEFIKKPESTLPILENLKYDDELYVRKSVANHLNDIAKDHPDFVVKILKRWQQEVPTEHKPKIDWITRHALRVLIKNGHAGALALVGVSSNAAIEIKALKVSPTTLQFGESLRFSFEIQSTARKAQKLVIDYVIHFVKASGKTAPKVFKLKTFSLGPNEKLKIEKSHAVRKITTRDYFPGKHTLALQINGKVVAQKNWTLEI
ncbi:MAG: hypothetical protein EOP05_10765 [Proteobacteria bacterium]|nr:MAG: hypothetical protein EOP05_10765 [Pseudomonadota bacterium]